MSLIKFSYQNNFVPEFIETPKYEESEQERLQGKLDDYNYEQTYGIDQSKRELRIWRNNQLEFSDWRIVSDAPGDTDAWKTYRQKLRDLPSSPKFPNKFETADFPLAPGESSIPEDVDKIISSDVDFVTIGRSAILHHDFPTKVLENQSFIPIDTPSPKEHLRKEGLSEKFIEYLKVFKGFVEE